MMPEDSALLELFISRDEQAISQTQQAYGRLCYTVAFNILGNAQDAEECVSDAMLSLWNAVPPAKPDSLRAYLLRITRNLAMNRQEAAHSVKRGGAEQALPLETFAEVLAAPDDTARSAEQHSLKEALGRFLAALPQETRIMFVERWWFMSSVQEIAREHGKGLSAVKMTLSRTRKKLEIFLKDEGFL